MANGTKILLVEDDHMIADMYKIRLEEEGFTMVTTDRGSNAVELAKSEQPNLVLLDIILPDLDGFTILKSLKSEAATKNIPVVMLTNLGQDSDKQKGAELGAMDYFVKAEHTPLEIVNIVKKLLNK